MYNILKKKLNNKRPIRDSLMRSETATYIRCSYPTHKSQRAKLRRAGGESTLAINGSYKRASMLMRTNSGSVKWPVNPLLITDKSDSDIFTDVQSAGLRKLPQEL